jgi:hypothetical protein
MTCRLDDNFRQKKQKNAGKHRDFKPQKKKDSDTID